MKSLHCCERCGHLTFACVIFAPHSGCDWIQLPAATYRLRTDQNRSTRCQIEVDIVYEHVRSHSVEGEWSRIAPLRILSFDIECQGRKGHFPEPEHDPVIQIANTITLQGQDQPIIRNVFTLNTCLPIVGAQVISSSTEEELLNKWKAFLQVNCLRPMAVDLLNDAHIGMMRCFVVVSLEGGRPRYYHWV